MTASTGRRVLLPVSLLAAALLMGGCSGERGARQEAVESARARVKLFIGYLGEVLADPQLTPTVFRKKVDEAIERDTAKALFDVRELDRGAIEFRIALKDSASYSRWTDTEYIDIGACVGITADMARRVVMSPVDVACPEDLTKLHLYVDSVEALY